MRNRQNEEMVTITRKEYENLLRRSKWLYCLEAAGVDNWQGIDYAYELDEEMEED